MAYVVLVLYFLLVVVIGLIFVVIFAEFVAVVFPLARGNEEKLRLDTGRVEYWKTKGAQPSDRVAKLIKDALKAAA